VTQTEWLSSSDPASLLRWLTGTPGSSPEGATGVLAPARRPSDRKLRQFAVACCRAAGRLLDKGPELAVKAAEMHADGLVADSAMMATRRHARLEHGWAWCASGLDIAVCLRQTVANEYASGPNRNMQADILRDMVGDPFSPVTLPPGPTVRCCLCRGEREVANCRLANTDGVVDIVLPASEAASLSPSTRGPAFRCPKCEGRGETAAPCPWITPEVLSLATAAYEERGGQCEHCQGSGNEPGPDVPYHDHQPDCRRCRGRGRVEDGTLDNARLAVLSDALEESGCVGDAAWTCGDDGKHSHGGTASGVYHGVKHDTDPRKPHHHHDEKCPRTHSPHPVLAHLRSPGLHYRGMWSLDLVLGKE